MKEEGYKKKITTTLGDHLRLRTGLALFLGGNGGAEPGAPNTRPDDLANYGLQPLALRPHQPLLVHGGCCAPLPVTTSQNIGGYKKKKKIVFLIICKVKVPGNRKISLLYYALFER